MQNYHRHTSYSNIFTPDSAAINEDYAKRAVELGHKVISSVEHGWQGNYFECFELAKKYDLKFIFGVEAYWVRNRTEEYPVIDAKTNEVLKNADGKVRMAKDRSNNHIILLAKNENGRRAINRILSTANEDGYYYRPRVDLDLLLSLPPDDVLITTACIAFWHYKDIDDILAKLKNHFQKNILLEIQYHNTLPQIELNKRILRLSYELEMPMIVGLDSHFILPEQSAERDYILAAKGVHYEDEEGWMMDYPDDDTVVQRFLQQNVFNKKEIISAMDRTDCLLDFEGYETLPDGNPNNIFNQTIKLPTLYDGKHSINGELLPELNQEQKNKLYSRLITAKFKNYTADLPTEDKDCYYQGVKDEVQTVKDTGMADYFLIDYEIVKKALEKGAVLTNTGRGSAVSFMTNTLLGFSKVDRFQSPIKLYPERFMSTTRILQSASLPDIDLNWGTPEVAEEAQKEILGADHVYPMIAFGTAKKKSAFKLYARSQSLDFELANDISKQIEKYDDAMKYAEDDEKDDIDIYDYVDEQYHSYINASKKYWGIIMDKKKAPCAFLLYNGNIREEIGLIKCKSESTNKEYITTVIDGAIAENYKFLKNDILKIDCALLTDMVFKRIGMQTPTVEELREMTKNDNKTWDIYRKGLTVGINQCEKESTMKKAMNYKPHNISELSAFIAAIRPGFKSMYKKFENREEFSYGIPALDRLIQTKEMPVSFMIYQEQVMQVLNYAGFPIDQCYTIIKAIAKKHPEKVRPLKEQFLVGLTNILITDEKMDKKEAEETAAKIWTIINDNCSYSFNCVSGSTILKRMRSKKSNLIPTVEEMYRIKNDLLYAKTTNHYPLHQKYKYYGYGSAFSMFEDKKIRKNLIVDIQPSGIQQTYKIITESGCNIICTKNHRFPTPNGDKRLDELFIGDELYCMGEYIHAKFDSSFTDGNFKKNWPKKGECGFQEIPDGNSVIYQKERQIHLNNQDSCEICGTIFDKNKHFELHHINNNRHDNSIENFQWVCNSCHKKEHYKLGRKKQYSNGISVYLSKIVSIEPYKIEQVYDIEMADPAHNFVLDNGLVTCNSSHAYCMGLDSLYQAWQKAHYPYEFYEVLLQVFSDKGKKDKVAELKKEMLRGFGISEGDYKFGLDNRKFSADKQNHAIQPSLLSIKGLSQSTANDLYKLGLNHYDSFYDVWKAMRTKKSLNSAKINILVGIGYFKDFAKIGKLKKFLQVIDNLFGRNQFSKNALPVENMEYIIKYSQKETDKLYKEFDYDAALNEIWNDLPDEDIPVKEKLQCELDNIGYIRTAIPDLSTDYVFVQNYECKFKNPKLTLYRLCDGRMTEVKVKRVKYDKAPISEGDIIKILDVSKEGKWFKDENGDWQQDNSNKEAILKKWAFVLPE